MFAYASNEYAKANARTFVDEICQDLDVLEEREHLCPTKSVTRLYSPIKTSRFASHNYEDLERLYRSKSVCSVCFLTTSVVHTFNDMSISDVLTNDNVSSSSSSSASSSSSTNRFNDDEATFLDRCPYRDADVAIFRGTSSKRTTFVRRTNASYVIRRNETSYTCRVGTSSYALTVPSDWTNARFVA